MIPVDSQYKSNPGRNREKTPSKPAICLALSLVLVVMTACKSNFPENEFYQEATQKGHTAFKLGPGDSIVVRVYEHADLSGTFNIDDTGRVSLPLILGINTKGLTLPELEKKIAEELTRNYIVNPRVSVDLVKARPYCILGEVRNPGCFSGIHGMTAAQAIAIAGGYTYRAYKEKFAVTREDGSKVVADTSTPIFGGDTIQIYERYF